MIKILVTGDFCPILSTEKLVVEVNYKNIFRDINTLLEQSDVNITNLECPLTNSEDKILKTGPHLKSSPQIVDLLKLGKFNVTALANNHILDYGQNGLQDTLDLLDKNSIKYMGAGKNLNEARKPLILQVNNKQIGILNFAENEFSIATNISAGANPLDIINNYYDIIKTNNIVDYLIVYIHGGNENYNLPNLELVKTCRFFVDIGVDAIFISHSHCPSGYEVYKAKPIFYGLGNFLFDWNGSVHDDWHYGYMVNLNIGKEIKFEIIPYTQFKEYEGIRLLKGNEKDEIIKKILSLNAIITNEELLTEEWDKFFRKNEFLASSFLFSFNPIIKRINKIFNILKITRYKEKALGMKNFISCESHRLVLLNTLKRMI
jgi:poly-gamma-glutamate synthesis protein (capsule biosynthesis protein)